MNAAAPTSRPEAPADAHDEFGHVLPVRVLLGVFGALVVLTAVTVSATWIDLGGFNVALALVIATAKASLVALYFMHLRYDHPFNALLLIAALAFVALFLALTLGDAMAYHPDVEAYREAGGR